MNTWEDYNKKTKGEPRPMLVAVIKRILIDNPKALDLGCGAGNETRFLKQKGFTVVSVDANPGVRDFVPDAIISKFEDYEFPMQEFDLVVAMYSLPFCAPDKIDGVMMRSITSMKHGATFIGQFFGLEDSWSGDKNMNFKTRAEIEKYFVGFELEINEKKYSKETAMGEPHFWHVFHVIAKKI